MARRTAQKITLEGNSKQVIEMARNRLVMVAAMFALAFLAIAGRVVDLTVFKASSEPPTFAKATTNPQHYRGRADIVDRNGELLATTVETASLYANTKFVIDPKDAAQKLHRVFPELSAKSLQRKLSSGKYFIWLKRHLTPREQFQVNALGLPGINFQKDVRRIYPFGSLASHVVGYTDIDNNGLTGIEKYFDKSLRTQPKPIQLAMDVRVQYALRGELKKAIEKHQAIGGAGVIMNAKTGEVVAISSYPDFDPHNPQTASSNERFNRAILGTYEMGSTFKIFNTAMALDSKTSSLYDSYDATKPIKIAGGFTIRDFKPKNSMLTVPEIFIHSSNIGSAKMAMKLGADKQKIYLHKLGLLEQPAVELLEVGQPQYPNTWRDVNTMTISYGHGIAVSPLQLATATATTINGGYYLPPTLLKYDSERLSTPTQVISGKTSEQMRRLLRLVVEKGTGSKANAEGYVVGGKTGTAEKLSSSGYQKKTLLSSFVAAFPMQDPNYVVFIMVDEPVPTADTYGYATGGWVAAPAVSNVITRISPLLNVRPLDETNRDLQRVLTVEAKLIGNH